MYGDLQHLHSFVLLGLGDQSALKSKVGPETLILKLSIPDFIFRRDHTAEMAFNLAKGRHNVARGF